MRAIGKLIGFLFGCGFTVALIFKRDDCPYKFDVDENPFRFVLIYEDVPIFFSDFASVVERGTYLSTKDSSLSLIDNEEVVSQDRIGNYSKLNLNFVTSFKTPVTFSIYIYENCRNLVFEQYFPHGLEGTSVGDPDSLSTRFPTFIIGHDFNYHTNHTIKNVMRTGYAQWISWYYGKTANDRKLLVAPGFQTPIYGLWDKNVSFDGGIGGSGVICLYREDGKFSVVLSSLTSMMTLSHESPQAGALDFGIMGNASSFPKVYSVKVIMQFGRGINSVMEDWGITMRKFYNKKPSQLSKQSDLTLNYIGYTTDNGAYYYYNTLPNMSYEDTIIEIKSYADQQQLPYRYVLLDSWWYYKGESGGVTDWSPRPDIFPNGLQYLFNATSWYIQAHNRYWDKDAVYASENNGKYKFIIDYVQNGSVPIDRDFWSDLFGNSSSWGLQVYEQDWLYNEFYFFVSQMLNSVELGRLWLSEMAAGAKNNNLTIQYCMPHIRHLLQSLEYDVVTQARASDDYVVSPYVGVDNWRIGGQIVLFEAIGLASSKDGFWTSKYQSGNPYGDDKYEPYALLHSAVATLSGGPVAVGDGLGFTDVDLVMRSCTKEGKLLQPTFPSRLIDKAFYFQAFGDETYPNGEVWFASSYISGYQFGYVFVADLKKSYSLLLEDVDLDRFQTYLAYNKMDETIKLFSLKHSLPLSACGLDDFSVYTISPIFKNGWSVLGEVEKWVGMSSARFVSIDIRSDEIAVAVSGSFGEVITIGFVDPDMNVIVAQCSFESAIMIVGSNSSCTQFESQRI